MHTHTHTRAHATAATTTATTASATATVTSTAVGAPTVGASAVGNGAFVDFISEHVAPTGRFRIFNKGDVVPLLAMPVGYRHARVPLHMKLAPGAVALFKQLNADPEAGSTLPVAGPHVPYAIAGVMAVFPILGVDVFRWAGVGHGHSHSHSDRRRRRSRSRRRRREGEYGEWSRSPVQGLRKEGGMGVSGPGPGPGLGLEWTKCVADFTQNVVSLFPHVFTLGYPL